MRCPMGSCRLEVRGSRCGVTIKAGIIKDVAALLVSLARPEGKGRAPDARTVTITRSEILTALNTPEEFVLAIVEVEGDTVKDPVYVQRPFQKEPDFGVTSANYNLAELFERAETPR